MGGGERLVELDKRRSHWVSCVGRGDAEAYGELVTPEVVWVPPSGEVVAGRSAFQAWVASFFRDFVYELALHPEDVALRGDWAIERGRFVSRLLPRSSGSSSTHEGKYSLVWQRCADGRWRIDRYVDTSDDTAS